MNSAQAFVLAAAAIFGIGAYGLLISEHVLRKLLALNLMGSAVFLLLVGVGHGEGRADPVPQALVLTGIVVAVSATAFALALLIRMYEETGSTTIDPPEDHGG